MTIKNKETLEKLRTYQIGVIRSVIASRQGRLKTYLADATDRERLADTDGLAYEEYYESPLTIRYDGLCRNVLSLEFCEDGLTPVCPASARAFFGGGPRGFSCVSPRAICA